MKTFFALGALAALCQSAFGLEQGTYTIGSASLQSDKILSENQENGALSFAPQGENPNATWVFTLADSNNKRDFEISSSYGSGYINCGNQEGSLCSVGDAPHIFTAELVDENNSKYELVAKNTGFFLRAEGDNLKIAGWDQSPNEEFILTSIE